MEQIQNKLKIFTLKELLSLYEENRVENLLKTFQNNNNEDVESFLQKKSILSTKKSQSMTHLIFSEDERYLVGYFTLTIKPISIVQDVFDNFSRKTRNKILRIAKLDKDTNSYALSAYLIAQLGKNLNIPKEYQISGHQIMEIIFHTIQKAQDIVGGTVCFVEAEPHKKLLDFYESEGFYKFANTQPNSAQTHSEELIQLLAIL